MILPSREDCAIIFFRIWPGLAYGRRMVLAFGLVALGLAIQALAGAWVAGALPLVAGNLLLLVRGYDNFVDFKAFDPHAHWERIETDRLAEIVRLDSAIRRWDRSALDVTNLLGAFVFLSLTGGLMALAASGRGTPRILALDGLILMLPHWVTGVRRVLRDPKLVTRARTLQGALQSGAAALEPHSVHLMALMGGDGAKVPGDLKLKIDLAEHHEAFLGLYGQVVLNEVGGTSYPYFYVVLVAREGFGLQDAHEQYTAPKGLTTEFRQEDAVEVLVLRQTTTKTAGYKTGNTRIAAILSEGLRIGESVSGGPPRAA
ncbi:MAG: hypothetical protein CMJ84_18205 [Planctomycetes bacterium]|nr:hypothetical protein [Planctomycetota bacterium]MDP6410536.1 hypothetical protein [Planctomycetota bacterium]